MGVVDILSADRVAVARGPGLSVRSKDEALLRLADLLAQGGPPETPPLEASVIARVLAEREAVGSTGVGNGVAIPHGALEALTRTRGAVLLVPERVSFDAIDGEEVSIFFAVIAPKRSTGEHLKTLARISRLLRDEGFRKRLLDQPSGAAAFDCIAREENGASS